MLKLVKRKFLIIAGCCAAIVAASAIVSMFIEILEAHNGAITAIATGFIGWFTYTLWRSSEKMWVATADQVRITNTALQLAREEFNATHRPKLRVRRMKPHLTAGTLVRVQYVIVNVGETTATIKRHDITLCIQPDDSGAKQTLQSSPLECPQLKGGELRLFFTNIDTQFDFGWGMANSILKIRGIVEYDDGAGTTRRTGFSADLRR